LGCSAIAVLGSTPVLLDEIQLAVVLRVEVADVTTLLNVLRKLGLLLHKVRLEEEDAAAGARRHAWFAFEPFALAIELTWSLDLILTLVLPSCDQLPRLSWPKSAFANNLRHPLELAWVSFVVVVEVERLRDVFNGTIGKPLIEPSVTHTACILAVLERCAWESRHLPSRQHVVCTFPMAGSVVEHAQSHCLTARLLLEDVKDVCGLLHDVVVVKPAVAVLARLKEDLSLPV
jgi:hypothetical protein